MIPRTCPVFGFKLIPLAGDDLHTPTLDRINSRRGYVHGNVWVICKRANTLKNDATIADLKKLVRALEKRRVQG